MTRAPAERALALQDERAALYKAQGACSGCEYSARCHAARQRVMDRRGIGRHSSCAFFLEWRQRERPEPPARPASWWRRLLGWA